ncbi:MAG: hypothetical protein JNL74_19100 [Fibrobacteres bacterium]|nr:hypothetical protein [Fibrobacterota bacterium]
MLYKMIKGDPKALKGEIIVFARIREPNSPENKKTPVSEVARNGIIAAHGDYRSQHSLADFLKNELGISLDSLKKGEEGEALPEGLDIEMIKKKMESVKGFEDMIPTPAKLEPFENEQEISQRDCDIYYLGEFDRLTNANLAVNALPILYQAVFREQQMQLVEREIEKIISGTENEIGDDNYSSDINSVEKRLNGEFISELLYNSTNKEERMKWEEKLRNYMWGYRYPAEIDKIITLTSQFSASPDKIKVLLELYVRKISAFLKEDYKVVGELKREIEALEK